MVVALGHPYRQVGVLTFHLGRQRSLHFMVVDARGHKVKQQSWTVRVVYGVGEISKKRRKGKITKK